MPLVNDLGADEMKGGISQTYEVRLRPAALPKIDESLLIGVAWLQPKVTAPATNSTTRTTIIRRDAEGMLWMYISIIRQLMWLKRLNRIVQQNLQQKMQQMRAQEVINYKDVSQNMVQ